jgi:acyl carrier protein phosphodiesterase
MVTFKAMNFLSHFYFEKDSHDENMVMGVVLPDLVKNAQKDGNLYPLKDRQRFEEDPNQLSILKGWERHIQVDAIFHSSVFFKLHTNALKQILLPVFENSPVKPFFLAHIGLELLLDHLLITDGIVNINAFYEHLAKADQESLDAFLQNCAVADTTIFFNFLNNFVSGKYLLSYQKIENISYALNRICMRLWDNPFTDRQLVLLTDGLNVFKSSIAGSYHSIFDEIELQINQLNLRKLQ